MKRVTLAPSVFQTVLPWPMNTMKTAISSPIPMQQECLLGMSMMTKVSWQLGTMAMAPRLWRMSMMTRAEWPNRQMVRVQYRLFHIVTDKPSQPMPMAIAPPTLMTNSTGLRVSHIQMEPVWQKPMTMLTAWPVKPTNSVKPPAISTMKMAIF